MDEQIARSVQLLDAYGPADWRARINPDRLDMANPYQCIGGQVYAEWTHLHPDNDDVYTISGYAIMSDLRSHLGIDLSDWSREYAFGCSLREREAWKRELAVR